MLGRLIQTSWWLNKPEWGKNRGSPRTLKFSLLPTEERLWHRTGAKQGNAKKESSYQASCVFPCWQPPWEVNGRQWEAIPQLCAAEKTGHPTAHNGFVVVRHPIILLCFFRTSLSRGSSFWNRHHHIRKTFYFSLKVACISTVIFPG